MVNVELLQVMLCPKCNSPMVGEEMYLYCADEACRRQYPVRSGMPPASEGYADAELEPVPVAVGAW